MNKRCFENKRASPVGLTRGSLLLKVYDTGDEVIGVRGEADKKWWCEVYKAGKMNKVVDSIETFPVELDLISNRYDLKVHYCGVEMWVHGVFIEKGKTTSLTLNFNKK